MWQSDQSPGRDTAAGGFMSTAWTLVSAAAEESTRSQEALESLCKLYWYPLYAYLRRRGHPSHEAEDLTQGFFLMFLRRQDVVRVRREKGRFRSFLLTALNHYVLDEATRSRAAKRGGGHSPLPLDVDSAETRYSLEPAHDLTAEKLFDRRWAMTLIDHTLDRLQSRYVDEGKGSLFDALKPYLADRRSAQGYAELARSLGSTEGAVKVAVHRLRQRFQDLLRSAVADTVADEAEVDEEMRSLLAALQG
jgi:DNA-directed RNA polymerase specialized sigma24 family protein